MGKNKSNHQKRLAKSAARKERKELRLALERENERIRAEREEAERKEKQRFGEELKSKERLAEWQKSNATSADDKKYHFASYKQNPLYGLFQMFDLEHYDLSEADLIELVKGNTPFSDKVSNRVEYDIYAIRQALCFSIVRPKEPYFLLTLNDDLRISKSEYDRRLASGDKSLEPVECVNMAIATTEEADRTMNYSLGKGFLTLVYELPQSAIAKLPTSFPTMPFVFYPPKFAA